ncbi:MAG TPA: NAD-dependent epimerase/dehydratase family protein [Patescibacteria group bacterium]
MDIQVLKDSTFQRQKYILVTGSSGLIGSETVRFFIDKGFTVVGVDNDMRKYFFGEEASTKWQADILKERYGDKFILYEVDIRDDKEIEKIFKEFNFELIVHTAAQPSHDWAAREPLTDYTVNANGTLVILENFRKYCPKATFIYTSTNKVYGDNPNYLPLVELGTRWEVDETHPFFKEGIDESMSIDNTKHSLFGASKAAADLLVQEYGKYFNLNTVVFRGGCLTGSGHSGTQLHGFLAYLVKCIATGTEYTIFGYKGKQVRDNIHSSDLVNAFYQVYQFPHQGEVYNMGGSRFSNVSMIEAIEKIEKLVSKKAKVVYTENNRIGDHIWYVSDVSKFKKHYPDWNYKYDVDAILEDICKNGHY